MEAQLLRAASSSVLRPCGSKISRPGGVLAHQTWDKNCSLRFQNSRFSKDGILAVHASATTIGFTEFLELGASLNLVLARVLVRAPTGVTGPSRKLVCYHSLPQSAARNFQNLGLAWILARVLLRAPTGVVGSKETSLLSFNTTIRSLATAVPTEHCFFDPNKIESIRALVWLFGLFYHLKSVTVAVKWLHL